MISGKILYVLKRSGLESKRLNIKIRAWTLRWQILTEQEAAKHVESLPFKWEWAYTVKVGPASQSFQYYFPHLALAAKDWSYEKDCGPSCKDMDYVLPVLDTQKQRLLGIAFFTGGNPDGSDCWSIVKCENARNPGGEAALAGVGILWRE